MSSQFCKTLGDGLFFSSPFYFGSWQATIIINNKEKISNCWRCLKKMKLRTDPTKKQKLLLINKTSLIKSVYLLIQKRGICDKHLNY
jgi:hypothetical protein